jgi:hypothetical protein
LLPIGPSLDPNGINCVLIGLGQGAETDDVFRFHHIDGEKAGHGALLLLM